MEVILEALSLFLGGLAALLSVLWCLRRRAARRLAKLVGFSDTQSFQRRYEFAVAVYDQLEISPRHFAELCDNSTSGEEFTLPFLELLSVSDKTRVRTFAQLLEELENLAANPDAPDASVRIDCVRDALEGQLARLRLHQRDVEHFPQLNTFYWLAVAILANRSRWIDLPLGINESCEGLIERGLHTEIEVAADRARSRRPFASRNVRKPSGTSRVRRS